MEFGSAGAIEKADIFAARQQRAGRSQLVHGEAAFLGLNDGQGRLGALPILRLDGSFQLRHLLVHQRADAGDLADFATGRGGGAGQVVQLARQGFNSRAVRREVGGVAGQQVAALAGFGIFHGGEHGIGALQKLAGYVDLGGGILEGAEVGVKQHDHDEDDTDGQEPPGPVDSAIDAQRHKPILPALQSVTVRERLCYPTALLALPLGVWPRRLCSVRTLMPRISAALVLFLLLVRRRTRSI